MSTVYHIAFKGCAKYPELFHAFRTPHAPQDIANATHGYSVDSHGVGILGIESMSGSGSGSVESHGDVGDYVIGTSWGHFVMPVCEHSEAQPIYASLVFVTFSLLAA